MNAYCFLLSLSSHRLFYFFYSQVYFSLLRQNLVLDNHTVELGTQRKDFVLQGASTEDTKYTSLPIPQEFDLNSRVRTHKVVDITMT
jgi:hypothetical protein